jgi:hypothetical protein
MAPCLPRRVPSFRVDVAVVLCCVQAKLTKNPKGYTLWCKELL